MKKRVLSLVLVLALALSLCPWALAAESRETDFFEDQPHTELNFDEIEYKHIEAEPILAAMEEIRGLMVDAANEETVAEKFDAVADQYMELYTMYIIANILVNQDATNETYTDEFAYTYSILLSANDKFIGLCRDLLKSPCAAFLKAQMTEEDIEFYLDYEDMTEEEQVRAEEETAQTQAYQTAVLQPFTVEYEGESYDSATLYEAYVNGIIDDETYNALDLEIVKIQNATLGEYFMDLVALRQEIAKAAGYDNYADYSYAEIFSRDYTPESIQPFFDAIKANMVDASSVLSTLANYETGDPAFVQDYTGDDTLQAVESIFHQMSSELGEAYSYMLDHKMYDLTYSETKQNVGFTTMLYNYGAPFMLNQPSGNIYDFITLIHEMGHYNNYYWTPAGWNDSVNNIDTAEVHSQGLELLFAHNYPEFFGESANAVSDYLIANMVSTIIWSGLRGELERYIYTTPDVTLEQINIHYLELQKQYGITTMDDPREMAYGWILVDHFFTSPCYYISYGVSAAGALAFWLNAQEDYFQAVDKYLEFVALPAETGFQESFEKLGMDNPLSAEYIEALAAELLVATDAEARLPGLMLSSAFTDIEGSPWYTDVVLATVMGGLMSGYDDGTFRPNAEVSWGMAAKVTLLHMGIVDVAPVEGGTWASGYLAKLLELGLIDSAKDQNTPITRAEFAQLYCNVLELPASENKSPFTDEADGYAVALAELGILDGFTAEDGTVTFQGEGSLTRAQLCQILCNITEFLAAAEAAAAEEVPAA